MIALRINTNITAFNAHRHYGTNVSALSRNVERLSSGFRVNRAADDAAGLAISEKMRAQIRGLGMASRNSQDAISLIQTAEGGMQTIHDILQRMNEIAVQASTGTNVNQPDRAALNAEAQQLIKEIDQIAGTTQFNQTNLLDGSVQNLTIQSGANAGQITTISIGAVNAQQLNVNNISLATQDSAQEAITEIQNAINIVSVQRANLGAMQNRFDFKIQNLDNQAENTAAAESRIRDVDMAHEMISFARNSILLQSSTAMLAQANAIPQSVVQLLVDSE